MEFERITTTKPLPFSNVARALELKTFYEETVHMISVQSKRHNLTLDTALWFVQNARKFNVQNQYFKQLYACCVEYINIGRIKYSDGII